MKQDELRLLLAPGGSRNSPSEKIIGIFGVGGKRAGVALGESVIIKTRQSKGPSFQIDIGKEWLESESWELPYYQIPDITAATTRVEISYLRRPLVEGDIEAIQHHFSQTYSEFLSRGVSIIVNGTPLAPTSLQNWCYPPGFHPLEANFDVDFGDDGSVSVIITGGLILDRDPERENYGAYFLCNDRLIAKELKTREVGYFVSSEAGVPHPDASLCRVIVQMAGPAKLMPWTSNKSGINFDHPLFGRVRPTIIQLMAHFTQLSRRLKNDWSGSAFKYTEGDVIQVEPNLSATKTPLVLPPLPKVRRKRVEKLKAKNKAIIAEQPWTLGLVEAMGAVEILDRQRLETKNRISLILLDSNFEIALKEFIVHRHDLFPPNIYNDEKIRKLFSRRPDVVAEINSKVPLTSTVLTRVHHYYGLRNKLIHERATVDILASDVANYKKLIGHILKKLFGLTV